MLDVKSHLSQQHILNQLETAVLDSTHSMHQLEVLGASLLLKLLVTEYLVLVLEVVIISLAISTTIYYLRLHNNNNNNNYYY